MKNIILFMVICVIALTSCSKEVLTEEFTTGLEERISEKVNISNENKAKSITGNLLITKDLDNFYITWKFEAKDIYKQKNIENDGFATQVHMFDESCDECYHEEGIYELLIGGVEDISPWYQVDCGPEEHGSIRRWVSEQQIVTGYKEQIIIPVERLELLGIEDMSFVIIFVPTTFVNKGKERYTEDRDLVIMLASPFILRED